MRSSCFGGFRVLTHKNGGVATPGVDIQAFRPFPLQFSPAGPSLPFPAPAAPQTPPEPHWNTWWGSWEFLGQEKRKNPNPQEETNPDPHQTSSGKLLSQMFPRSTKWLCHNPWSPMGAIINFSPTNNQPQVLAQPKDPAERFCSPPVLEGPQAEAAARTRPRKLCPSSIPTLGNSGTQGQTGTSPAQLGWVVVAVLIQTQVSPCPGEHTEPLSGSQPLHEPLLGLVFPSAAPGSCPGSVPPNLRCPGASSSGRGTSRCP